MEDWPVDVVEQRPGLEVDKSVSDSTFSTSGEQLVYTVTVSNTGNVPIEPEVSDPLCPLVGDEGPIAPGAAADFTCDYEVTDADIEAGEILNVATATVTSGDQTVTADGSATATYDETETSEGPTPTDVPTPDADHDTTTSDFPAGGGDRDGDGGQDRDGGVLPDTGNPATMGMAVGALALIAVGATLWWRGRRRTDSRP